MSYLSLLKDVCIWKRVTVTASAEFGEQEKTETVLVSAIACRLDNLQNTVKVEGLEKVGEILQDLYMLYLDIVRDVQVGDIFTITGHDEYKYECYKPINAGGHHHHSEIIVKRTMIK